MSNLSEEEKKALENLKNILSDLEDTENGAIISLNQEEIDSLKSIPKLIENQQYEIEGNEALIDVLKHNDKVWNELYHKQEKELKKIEALNIPVDTLIAEFKRLENIEDDREQLKEEIKALKPNLKELIEIYKNAMQKDYISKDKIKQIINKYVDIEEHLKYTSQELYGEDLKNIILELLGEDND